MIPKCIKKGTLEVAMAKEVIIVDGEERLVREDTAKAYRGVYWALLSIAGFLLIMAVLIFAGVIKLASDGELDAIPAAANDGSVNAR
jgi:hypothetical protein